jgi:hypothetical protein
VLTTCNTFPVFGLVVVSTVPLVLGKVSVAVTASVGVSVVLPLVAPFNTSEPIFILMR